MSFVFYCKYYLRINQYKGVLVDVIPNLFTAFSLPFLFYIFKRNTTKSFILNYFFRTIFLLFFYELSQLLDEKATFDWLDIIASLVGAAVSTYILSLIIKEK